jgi:oligopeptide/dipeptide ABC transporter ATP-binding protein
MQQRAMIAMALACDPDLLVADEPTTALVVTIQAQILDRLDDLQDEHGMGIVLITHDLGVVQEVCDRVAAMYAGQLVETGTVEAVFDDPKHPYTRALFESIPRGRKGEEELDPIGGQVPELIDMADACFFVPRCPYAHDACYDGRPELTATDGSEVRCVLYDQSSTHGPEVLERESLEGGEDAAERGEDGGPEEPTGGEA